jgi:hypothetical protein
MKLVDSEETVVIAIASDLEPGHPDRHSAARLKEEVDARGRGWPYRRAVIVDDESWFDTELFLAAPTIAIGGPGANGVSARLAGELPTVWTDGDRVVIQVDLADGRRRASLWGSDRHATTEAVEAFIARGWLDEFLDRCWRFKMGNLA